MGARGRALSHWLQDGEFDGVYAQMSPQLQRAAGGREGLARQVAQIESRFGHESALLREAAYDEQGLVHYYRIARYSALPEGTLTLHWVWQPHGEIVGATIMPTPAPAAIEYLDYHTP